MGGRPKVTKAELLKQMSEIKNSDNVKKALHLAMKAHRKQLREGGGSYLTEHVYLVASLLYEEFKNDSRINDLVTISLLHDVVEDGGVKITNIENLFGNSISKSVALLSKTDEEEDSSLSQDEKYIVTQNYLLRLSEDIDAVIVKLFDRLANIMSIMEDSVLSKHEKYLRYIRETKNLYIPLAKKYNFTKIVKKFEDEIDRIEKLF